MAPLPPAWCPPPCSTLSSRLMGCDLGLVPQSDKDFHELPPENPFMRNYSCFDMKKASGTVGRGRVCPGAVAPSLGRRRKTPQNIFILLCKKHRVCSILSALLFMLSSDPCLFRPLRHSLSYQAQHWYADGIVTYKRSANAAKVLVYAMHGIPVIADAAPSIIEAVERPGLGYVAEHRSAWEVYIGSFLTVSEERKRLSERAVDFTSQRLGDAVRGATLVDFFLREFPKRLPEEVVTRCAAARGLGTVANAVP